MTTATQPLDIYDRTTIHLHWATAGLVLLLWVMGQTADLFPRGALRDADWSLHVILGFLLGSVLLGRLYWRLGPGRRLASVDGGFVGSVATLMHYALYALLVAVVILGIANAFVRGMHLFGNWALPQIGNPALRRDLTEWHELAANTIMIMALAHALAALAHHHFLHDDVLRRMIPSRGRNAEK